MISRETLDRHRQAQAERLPKSVEASSPKGLHLAPFTTFAYRHEPSYVGQDVGHRGCIALNNVPTETSLTELQSVLALPSQLLRPLVT